MKIIFQNGSKIEAIETSNNIRSKRAEFYKHCIDGFNLKWWQKIYLKVYYHWIGLMFKCGWKRY